MKFAVSALRGAIETMTLHNRESVRSLDCSSQWISLKNSLQILLLFFTGFDKRHKQLLVPKICDYQLKKC